MLKNLRLEIVREYGTQIEFAKAIGEDDATVSKVMRGYRDISDKKKKKWAKALKCKVSDIFGE